MGSMKSAKSQVNQDQQGENQRALSPLQSTLSSAASPSQAYETYIDNGLICLKHKIRNIEKKKLKLEDYKDRLKNGEQLNPDQLKRILSTLELEFWRVVSHRVGTGIQTRVL